MADLKIRQLEIALAREPSNLDTRQRLLTAYGRTGVLVPGDLVELAALGDIGAIQLTGKTPNLDSRSKRFYLRCAWVIIQQVFSKISTLELLKTGEEISLRWPDGYACRNAIETFTETLDVIEKFDSLMIRYLGKQITLEEKLIPLWRMGILSGLNGFQGIFDERATRLHAIMHETPDDDFPGRNNYRTFHYLVMAYQHLCIGMNKKIKTETDEAIYSAAMADLQFQGIHFNTWGDSPLRSEQFPTGGHYYTYYSKVLLDRCRPAIIRQWLPNYTPQLV